VFLLACRAALLATRRARAAVAVSHQKVVWKAARVDGSCLSRWFSRMTTNWALPRDPPTRWRMLAGAASIMLG
jgi:hypothetical protein